METAKFIFSFNGKESEDASYVKLQELLIANGWLTTEKGKTEPLILYHTKENGECEVVLAQDSTDDDFIDQIDNLFKNLIESDKVLWVKTIYNRNTAKIVYNNVDKYAKNQTFDIADMKEGEEVVIFIKK